MEEGITAYEISIGESDLSMKIMVGDKEVICPLKVNQAFAFMALFMAQLAALVSPQFQEAELGAFYVVPKKGGGGGGQDPSSSSEVFH